MGLNYFKRVSKTIYLRIHVRNKTLMDFLDRELKKINPQLSITTTLSQLTEIDQWKSKLISDTEERLKKAPSKTVALKNQIKETWGFLEFNKNANIEKNNGNDNYLNEYRLISYDHLSIGDDVTLQGLGYLLFHEHWEGSGDEEEFKGLAIISSEGLRIAVNAIAEGSAFAYHLPYLEDLLNQIETSGKIDHIAPKEKPAVGRVNSINSFDDLFFDVKDIPICLTALSKVEDPIINESHEYILGPRSKSAISAWWKVLWDKGYVKMQGNDKSAALINTVIHRLDISGKTLRDVSNPAFKKYIKDLEYQLIRKTSS